MLQTIGGWEFAYEDAGSGPAVFLLHGLLMDASMWDAQVQALSDRYRVIRVEAPGHGRTPPRPVGYTFEDEAQALGNLARSLGMERAVWGGHSMGGMKCLRLALA